MSNTPFITVEQHEKQVKRDEQLKRKADRETAKLEKLRVKEEKESAKAAQLAAKTIKAQAKELKTKKQIGHIINPDNDPQVTTNSLPNTN